MRKLVESDKTINFLQVDMAIDLVNVLQGYAAIFAWFQ